MRLVIKVETHRDALRFPVIDILQNHGLGIEQDHVTGLPEDFEHLASTVGKPSYQNFLKNRNWSVLNQIISDVRDGNYSYV